MKQIGSILGSLALVVFAGGHALAEEVDVRHTSFDGLEIDAKVETPAGVADADVRRAIVLVHGSGSHGADMDLAVVTAGREPNPVFKVLSNALAKAGFAVIRYNKRNHQLYHRTKAEKGYRETEQFKKAVKTPYVTGLIGDARSFVRFAKARFPKAKLHLLGVSEGTHVALWAAHELQQTKEIHGVALIGFYIGTLETVSFEQYVYRPLVWFRRYDTNHDGALDDEELKAAGELGMKVFLQMWTLDTNKDQRLDIDELKAGNMSNMLLKPLPRVYTRDEVAQPQMATVLRAARYKVAFFQGEWDNQTPAYHARAAQLANRTVWRKKGFKFQFFPKLGHALDPRDRYDDIVYRPMDPNALKVLVATVDELFSR